MTDEFVKVENNGVDMLELRQTVVQSRRFDVANLKKQLAEIQALLAEAKKLGIE